MTANGDFVTYGRWEEAHRALTDRVGNLETRTKRRGDRVWLLILGVGAPVVSTLLVTAVLTFLHLRGTA